MSDPSDIKTTTREQQEWMLLRRKMRRKRRKERDGEGEIAELNITPMLDMMTIILVFLLKSYSAQSVALASAGDIAPPLSTTRLSPKDTIAVTVTRCTPSPDHACAPGTGALIVMEKTILTYDADRIPPEVKEGGEKGLFIQPLFTALKHEVDKAKAIAAMNPDAPFTGELSVVGDKGIPYRMLTEVLYTAGRAELDSYRFVVLKEEGGGGE